MNKEPIVKKYTFSKEELLDLTEIQLALSSFRRAVAGMQVNIDFVLESAYKRIGIEREAREGYERKISYNLSTNEITVTDSPKEQAIDKP